MALTMALVVLLSTLSFTVNMHYCGDVLVETAMLKKAKGCGMDMEKPSAESCSIAKKNCCDDKQLLVEGQDELQLSADKISFEQQVFVASFFYTYINLFEAFDTENVAFQDYSPPIVVKQIFKLDETYLI